MKEFMGLIVEEGDVGIDKIIIHHSLTRDSETVSWTAIRKYHVETLGWSDVGYHFGIEEVNGSVEILIGRFATETGAHCKGHNKNSIGICVVGNFDDKEPSVRKWEKLKELIAYLSKTYGKLKLYSHNDLNNAKSCPGEKFDIERLREETISVRLYQ